MPISFELAHEGQVVHTIMRGFVTDDELLAYYRQQMTNEALPRRWRELVNGTAITTMAVTARGQSELATLTTGHRDRLRDGRVAMVASSDVVYGMFRMWELSREGLGYQVMVFKDLAEAWAWIKRDVP